MLAAGDPPIQSKANLQCSRQEAHGAGSSEQPGKACVFSAYGLGARSGLGRLPLIQQIPVGNAPTGLRDRHFRIETPGRASIGIVNAARMGMDISPTTHEKRDTERPARNFAYERS